MKILESMTKEGDKIRKDVIVWREEISSKRYNGFGCKKYVE